MSMINRLVLRLHPGRLFSSRASSYSLLSPEKAFFPLALFFGLIFALLTAPFQVPDEYIHFYRAYDISLGHLGNQSADLPKSVVDFSHAVSQDLPGNDQNKQSKKALLEEFSRRYQPEPAVTVDISNISVYSPLPYLPQALGIWVGRLFHFPPIVIFYLGRLVNLLVWLTLVTLALRLVPVHPRLLAALALMPMTLYMAASCSPDAFTNAISFLWIAFVLRLLFTRQRQLKPTDWLILAILACALALSKTVYVLLGGLLFLVPFRPGEKKWLILAGSLAVLAFAVLVGFAWLQYSVQYANISSTEQYGMPSVGDLRLILDRPAATAQIFTRTVQRYFFDETRMFVGVLGWLDTPLPVWVYPLYYLLLFFIVIFEPHLEFFFRLGEKLWMAALVLAGLLVMMVALFNPNVDYGNGISTLPQGRYYIPFAPLFFLPFSQKKWVLKSEWPGWAVVTLVHVVILIVAVRALLWRYYAI